MVDFKTGSRKWVKIQSFDAKKVFVTVLHKDEIIPTFLNLNEVRFIQFNEENINLSLLDTILLSNSLYIYEDIIKFENDSVYYSIVGLNGKENRSISINNILSVKINIPGKENKSKNSNSSKEKYENAYLGIGLGMDHGGIGLNLSVYPIKYIGVILGGGYNLVGAGLNAGLKLRIFSDRTTPYFSVMYGYNAVIKVQNLDQFNKTFYGTTVGFGADIRINPAKKNYIGLGVLIPFRSSSVETYMNDLRNNYGITFKSGFFPIGFSLSYRFILN